MSGPRSDALKAIALAVALSIAGAAARADDPLAAGAPGRVVSINLCTDQLAMLLAAPGQLVSVSWLASDPQSSSMVAEAAAFAANRGQAEQIFLMRPDLVLAGTYTSAATVALLRRLGVRVELVAPASSLAEVAAVMRQVGHALGRDEQGEAMARGFEAQVAAARVDLPPVTAAMYYPNGYTTGAGTVTDEILRLAAFRNVGAEAGLTGGGTLPLERLVMAAPRLVVTSRPYPGASRSEAILTHPALTAIREGSAGLATTDAAWICGTPFMLRAISAMVTARHALEGGTLQPGGGG